MLVGLLLLVGVACYFMTAEERARALRIARMAVEEAYATAQGGTVAGACPADVPERIKPALITSTLIFLNVAAFMVMATGSGSMSETQTLVAWGANAGTRTTNGEWHRVITSLFVHSGFLQMFVNVVGLGAVGFMTERLVGPATFVVVYLAAGVFAGIVSLSTHAAQVSFGASGAVLGIYGLLTAFLIRSLFREPPFKIRRIVRRRLGAAAAIFVGYNVFGDTITLAGELSAFAVGVAHGLFLAPGAVRARAPLRRVVPVVTMTLILAAGLALPMAGLDDVKPEIESLIATEHRTASAYDDEVKRYRARSLSADRLVQLIDGRILPELRATAERLSAFDNVLPEQRQLFELATAYLRLREESWRLRAQGLRQMVTLRRRGASQQLHASATLALRKAETTERAALDALQGAAAAEVQ